MAICLTYKEHQNGKRLTLTAATTHTNVIVFFSLKLKYEHNWSKCAHIHAH